MKLKLQGIKDELKNIDRAIRDNTPKLSKVRSPPLPPSPPHLPTYTDVISQAKKELDAAQSAHDTLAAIVNEAEDGIFGDFCARVGVEDIREYEERTGRVNKDESAARLRFDTQIARLRHQCVFPVM